MAFSLIANTAKKGTSSGVTTDPIDTTGADLIVLQVASYTGAADPTVSDSKGNTWTALTEYAQTAALVTSRLYYCASPTVGSGHTFTTSGASSFSPILVAAFSGSAAVPFDVENGADNLGFTLATGSVSPSENDELIITGFGAVPDAHTISINSGFTITDQVAGEGAVSWTAALAYLIQTTAAPVNPTWSYAGSGGAATGIATFKAAAGGGGTNITATPSAGIGSFAILPTTISAQQNVTTEAVPHVLAISAPDTTLAIGATIEAVAHALATSFPDATISVTSNVSSARSALVAVISLPRPTITAEGGVSNTLPGAIRIEIGLGL